MIVFTDNDTSGILRDVGGSIKWTKCLQGCNAFKAALVIVKEAIKIEDQLHIKTNRASFRRALKDPLQAPWQDRFTALRITTVLENTNIVILWLRTLTLPPIMGVFSLSPSFCLAS